jgi:hypothetical protein
MPESARQSDELPGGISDLERLMALATKLSAAANDQATSERHIAYASHLFAAMCLTADAVLRTHPLGSDSHGAKRKLWNPMATATLTRVLMEACLNLHYFCVDEISPDERDFRFIVADLHCVRERLAMSDAIRSDMEQLGRASAGTPDTSEVRDARVKADATRSELERQLTETVAQLLANDYKDQLSEKQRRNLVHGVYNEEGRYRGRGFALELRDRAARAGFWPSKYEGNYRHLSSYVHAAPSAIDQISAVAVDPDGMIHGVIPVLIAQCCGYVAVSCRYFASVFPQTATVIPSDMHELMDICTGFVIRTAW